MLAAMEGLVILSFVASRVPFFNITYQIFNDELFCKALDQNWSNHT